MAIKIYNDRIEFATYTLVVTPKGLSVNVSGTNATANFTASNIAISSLQFQGETYGFAAGGSTTPPETYSNVIDKFPFTAQDNYIDIGDLTVARKFAAGCSSKINGYVAGGTTGSRSNVIDKFQFASNQNATDVGNLTTVIEGGSGVSAQNFGYVIAGLGPSSAVNTIQKFSFAGDYNSATLPAGGTTAFNPPTTVTSRSYSAGITDSRYGYGYTVGGASAPGAALNTIQRLSFTYDAVYPISVIGGLITLGTARIHGAGISSDQYGYFAGGITSPTGTTSQNIQKFPFAIYVSAVDVPNITTQARYASSGISSKFAGYVAGGYTYPTTVSVNTVDKFPFAVDYVLSNDVGDLTTARGAGTGHQL